MIGFSAASALCGIAQSRRDDFLPSRAGVPGGILPVVTMTML